MQIGFIGLGIMGLPMAANLCRAGYTLLVCGHHPEKEAVLETLGARRTDAAAIGRTCDVVITMLPDSPQVRQVMLGPDGLAGCMRPGSVYIDASSIAPADAQEVGRALAARGVDMLDAPVSGGEPGAVAGTLSFMLGGRPEVFERCRPILLAMGRSAVLCGDLGAGNVTKLANQIIVACNIQALAEALTLAKKAGVDPARVYEAIRGGLAGSAVMEAKAPMMLAGKTDPGFRVALHRKDLNNALACAHAVGAPVPMAAQAQEILNWLCAQGGGGLDHSTMARYYERLTGQRLDDRGPAPETEPTKGA